LRRSALILHRYRRSTAIHLLLDVRSVLDVLVEAADVAGDLVPGFEGEGDNRDEAEGEPFPVLKESACDLVAYA
jgi:hypothetical protein